MKNIVFRRIRGKIIPIIKKHSVGAGISHKKASRIAEKVYDVDKRFSAFRSFVDKAAPIEIGGLYGKGLNKTILKESKKLSITSLDKMSINRKDLLSALKSSRKKLNTIRRAIRDPRNRPHSFSYKAGVTKWEYDMVTTNILGKKRFK